MNRSFYQTKIEEMLSNQEYEQLDGNPHKEVMKNYTKYLEKYQFNTTKKEFEYLTKFEIKPSIFTAYQKFINLRKLTRNGPFQMKIMSKSVHQIALLLDL